MTEWLSDRFIAVLNLSLPAGFAVVLVLLARLALRRAPKIYSYALWGAVLLRMVLPFAWESPASPIPVGTQSVPQGIAFAAQPAIESGFAPLDTAVNAVLPAATPAASVNPMQVYLWLGAWLWLLVGAGLITASLFSLVRLRRRLRGAADVGDGVLECDGIDTAFVLGLFRPRVYLPAGLDSGSRGYILRHERVHMRRGDHIVKLAFFLAACVHWFNPLVWVAFRLMCRDMEMSCDEAVLRGLDGGEKKAYAETLLCVASARRFPAGAPLAFGENDIRTRIRNALRFQKPAIWASAVCAVLAAAVAVGALLSPKSSEITAPPAASAQPATPVAAGEPAASMLRVYGAGRGKDEKLEDYLLRVAYDYSSPAVSDSLLRAVTASTQGDRRADGEWRLAGCVRTSEYRLADNVVLEEWSSSSTPFGARFRIEEDGGYTLLETYSAQDGAFYEDSVRAMCADAQGRVDEGAAVRVMESVADSELAAAHRAEAERILQEATGGVARAENGRDYIVAIPPEFSLGLPVKEGRGIEVSRPFSEAHGGVDIAAPEGTPVLAAAGGVVLVAEAEEERGLVVAIDHGNGIVTWYAHNSELLVEPGQTVKEGDTIALTGKTGDATGPHLHFALLFNDQPQNPSEFFRTGYFA